MYDAIDVENGCMYKTGTCKNKRAVKRDRSLHKLCDYHRARANNSQRKLDRKKKGNSDGVQYCGYATQRLSLSPLQNIIKHEDALFLEPRTLPFTLKMKEHINMLSWGPFPEPIPFVDMSVENPNPSVAYREAKSLSITDIYDKEFMEVLDILANMPTDEENSEIPKLSICANFFPNNDISLDRFTLESINSQRNHDFP